MLLSGVNQVYILYLRVKTYILQQYNLFENNNQNGRDNIDAYQQLECGIQQALMVQRCAA
jgi:hypothetical protein